jgi:hypothetical protein
VDAAWIWLTTPPETAGVHDWFGASYLVVFGLGFVVSAYLSGPGAESISADPLALAGARQWAAVGVGFFGVGLFFFGVRALQINPVSLGAPFWMAGWTIVTIVVVIRCLSWWRTVYPTLRAEQATARPPGDRG